MSDNVITVDISEREKRKKLDKFVKEFREKIPPIRNQLLLMDRLMDNSKTFYVDISNRTDGKTFQHVHFFIELSLKFDLKFTFICRHYDLRQSYIDAIEEVYIIQKLGRNKLSFIRKADYTEVLHMDKKIGIIVELLNATDLKNYSQFLRHFPILYYDEFLALPDQYVGDEWAKLKVIYESIDRSGVLPLIHHPKVFLTGNPLNFDSPIIFNLKLVNSMEKQDVGKIISPNKKTLLLIEHNKEVNAIRNSNAFTDEEDNLNVFETFFINTHNVARAELTHKIVTNGEEFVIELEEFKVRVNYLYVDGKLDVILSLLNKHAEQKAMFCERLSDMEKGTIYLGERFQKDCTKKYEKGYYLFDNSYTRNVLLERTNFTNINLNKCIVIHYQKEGKKPLKYDKKEQKFIKNSMYNTSLRLKEIYSDWSN